MRIRRWNYSDLEPRWRGPLGVVHRARCLSRGGRVDALTVLEDGPTLEATVKALAARMDRVGPLKSPLLVRDKAVVVFDEKIALSSIFVDGAPLSYLLEPTGLPITVAAGIAASVARALHTGFDRTPRRRRRSYGLVHGSLTPDDVLVSRNGQLRVAGLGRRPSEPAPGAKLLRPIRAEWAATLAPELAHNDIGHHTDVYALTAMLSWMLLGSPPPYAALDPDHHKLQVHQLASTIRHQVGHSGLAELIAWGLAHDPASRPRAAEVQTWLEKLLREAPGPDWRVWSAEHLPTAQAAALAAIYGDATVPSAPPEVDAEAESGPIAVASPESVEEPATDHAPPPAVAATAAASAAASGLFVVLEANGSSWSSHDAAPPDSVPSPDTSLVAEAATEATPTALRPTGDAPWLADTEPTPEDTEPLAEDTEPATEMVLPPATFSVLPTITHTPRSPATEAPTEVASPTDHTPLAAHAPEETTSTTHRIEPLQLEAAEGDTEHSAQAAPPELVDAPSSDEVFAMGDAPSTDDDIEMADDATPTPSDHEPDEDNVPHDVPTETQQTGRGLSLLGGGSAIRLNSAADDIWEQPEDLYDMSAAVPVDNDARVRGRRIEMAPPSSALDGFVFEGSESDAIAATTRHGAHLRLVDEDGTPTNAEDQSEAPTEALAAAAIAPATGSRPNLAMRDPAKVPAALPPRIAPQRSAFPIAVAAAAAILLGVIAVGPAVRSYLHGTPSTRRVERSQQALMPTRAAATQPPAPAAKLAEPTQPPAAAPEPAEPPPVSEPAPEAAPAADTTPPEPAPEAAPTPPVKPAPRPKRTRRSRPAPKPAPPPEPKPAPEPEPEPAPEPEPEPAPEPESAPEAEPSPAPLQGVVEVRGDARSVVLSGSQGTFSAGDVPAGRYTILATFSDQGAPVPSGSATVVPGDKVVVQCKAAFQACVARR